MGQVVVNVRFLNSGVMFNLPQLIEDVCVANSVPCYRISEEFLKIRGLLAKPYRYSIKLKGEHSSLQAAMKFLRPFLSQLHDINLDGYLESQEFRETKYYSRWIED